MRIFQRFQNKFQWSKQRYFISILSVLFLVYVASAIYHTVKPLPEGLDYTGPLRAAKVEFIADQTLVNAQGQVYTEQHIFNAMLDMVHRAKTTIVLDMFLLNDRFGQTNPPTKRLFAQELVQALVEKKRLDPNMNIIVMTDQMNSLYGSILPEEYVQLRRVGVELVETNLISLRASNPMWSGLWYLCCQGLGNDVGGGWLPSPLSSDRLTLRSYLNFLNFKTNHRRNLIVDTSEGWQALVGSKNINASGDFQSNTAVIVHGAAAVDVLNSEQPVAKMSDTALPYVLIKDEPITANTLQAQVLTEQAIGRAMVELLNQAKKADHVDVVAFCLSDRQVIHALKAAHNRGVNVRVLLNPNQDKLTRYNNGMPNRAVAQELFHAGVNVRWCERCHARMLVKRDAAQQRAELILGSANMTSRNLRNYNLETDIRVVGLANDPVFMQAQQHFNQSWLNEGNVHKSVAYEEFASYSRVKYWLYRFMEWTGFSSF
ncbi:phospholipase [Acinetobacter sp. B10A]|uniref:phospholipase D-like domain-containing protein n=1 Tax=Acinetobacter baretiae TaxID=2605383 RepID=UPI001B3C6F78|nr:phospholipase D-like domain-containing protein [Acinetobacter baretiae]MBF7685171.1 phospholipase [Acinetobacter baretiae]